MLDLPTDHPRGAERSFRGGRVMFALTPEQHARLNKERKIRLEAGFEAPALGSRVVAREIALSPSIALRGREGATIDPYRACVGLAEAAEERGAQLFEKSPVRRVTFNRKIADVHTAGGKIRTKKVIVAMEHTTRDGGHKIMKRCTLPFTGLSVVNLIVTEMAVIEVAPEGLVLREVASDTTVERVQAATGVKLIVPEQVGTFG